MDYKLLEDFADWAQRTHAVEKAGLVVALGAAGVWALQRRAARQEPPATVHDVFPDDGAGCISEAREDVFGDVTERYSLN